jgi:hypothetical protein
LPDALDGLNAACDCCQSPSASQANGVSSSTSLISPWSLRSHFPPPECQWSRLWLAMRSRSSCQYAQTPATSDARSHASISPTPIPTPFSLTPQTSWPGMASNGWPVA